MLHKSFLISLITVFSGKFIGQEKGHDSFLVLKKKKLSTEKTETNQTILENKGEVKTVPERQKLEKCISTRSVKEQT